MNGPFAHKSQDTGMDTLSSISVKIFIVWKCAIYSVNTRSAGGDSNPVTCIMPWVARVGVQMPLDDLAIHSLGRTVVGRSED